MDVHIFIVAASLNIFCGLLQDGYVKYNLFNRQTFNVESYFFLVSSVVVYLLVYLLYWFQLSIEPLLLGGSDLLHFTGIQYDF